jgi:CheY-like chemotaxis protein
MRPWRSGIFTHSDSPLSEPAGPVSDPRPSIRGVALVVDDDDDDRALLAEVLAANGFAVVHAKDGEAALSVLEEMNPLPSVVLLDWRMPRLGGEGFLRAIQADPRFHALNVVVVSGHPLAALPFQTRFVPKPVTDALLLRVVLGRARPSLIP